MDVSSRGSLDTACTSTTSADLMLCKWAFRAELVPILLRILQRSRGSSLEAFGAELLSVEMVVVAEAEPGSKPDSEADFQGL